MAQKPAAKGKRTKWADIFADASSYGDDMQIVLKDAEGNDLSYRLGDLREYNEESQGELLSSIESREAALKDEAKNIELARNAVVEKYNEIQQFQGKRGKQGAAPAPGSKLTPEQIAEQTGLDENDPLVGQLVRELNAVKGDAATKMEALNSQVGGLQNIVKTVLGTYLEDNYKSQFSSVEKQIKDLPEKSQKKYSYDAIKKHAETRRLTDEAGRLDLNRAFRDLAFDDILEVEADRRAEARIKTRDQERRMSQISHPERPGSNLPKPTIDVSKSVDPLGDAFSAAMQDEEMWQGLTSTGQ